MAVTLVPCPVCKGHGEIVVLDLIAGYWGTERLENSYSCDACSGKGELPQDEAELHSIAARTEELLTDEALNPEHSRKLLEEFIAGLDSEPQRLEREHDEPAEQTAELLERRNDEALSYQMDEDGEDGK